MNRVESLVKSYKGTEDSDDIMLEVMDALSETVTPVPDLGNYYTFVYQAKTPNITYDVHPLIAALEYFPGGFKGYNFHWQRMRNYTFLEVVGQLYYVYPEEMNDLERLTYQKFVLNR